MQVILKDPSSRSPFLTFAAEPRPRNCLGRFRRFGRFEVKVKGEGEQWREFPVPQAKRFPVSQLFVIFRVGATWRFVSAASDDP
jgi:hypothetical protein